MFSFSSARRAVRRAKRGRPKMTDMNLARAFPGRYFCGQGRSIGTGGVVPPLDTLIAVPFDAGGEFDAIGALVKVGGSADAVLRAGIYDCDATGLPGSLIETTDEYEANTGHQNQFQFDLAAPVTLTDPYWVAILFGGTTAPEMLTGAALVSGEFQRLFGIAASAISTGVFNVNTANAVTASYSYAALPSTFPTPTLGGTSLWLGVRSPT